MNEASHAIELGIVMGSVLFLGPGATRSTRGFAESRSG
jgi:hypothetical protein